MKEDQKPWFRHDPYDPTLPDAIRRAWTVTGQWRLRTERRHARLEWAYMRDRYRGEWARLPGEVRREFGWLANKTPPAYNLVKKVVDSVASRMQGQPRRLDVGTVDATFEQRSVARARSLALEGTLNTPDAAASLAEFGRDGLLRGGAAVVPRFSGGKMSFHRIPFRDLFVDPFDCAYGGPTHCVWQETVDRDLWLAWYKARTPDAPKDTLRKLEGLEPLQLDRPDRAAPAGVQSSQVAYTPYEYDLDNADLSEATERLAVCYCYRRASAPGVGDGRCVIVVYGADGDGVVAVDQSFSRVSFPLVWWSPYPPIQGMTSGLGMGDAMLLWQESLDRAIYKVSHTVDELGHAKVLYDSSSPVGEEQKLSLATAGITMLPVDGFADAGSQKAVVVHPQTISPDTLQWIELILRWSQSSSGVNEMLSEGLSQLGANAPAAALRLEDRRQVDRLTDVFQRFDTAIAEVARQVQHAIDDELAVNPKLRASYLGDGGSLVWQNWSELSAPSAEYVVRVEGAGSLANQRAGDIAQILDEAQRGLISAQAAQEGLLHIPDVRALSREQLASYHLVQKQLGILASDKADQWDDAWPDQDTPAALAVKLATTWIQLGKIEDAEPETILRLREYKLMASRLLQLQGPDAGSAGSPGAEPTPPLPG